VDQDLPPVAKKVLAGGVFTELVDCFLETMKTGKRIFFTGCGATGRLSILLEAAWRRFWQELKAQHPDISSKLPDLEDIAYSIMAGGDFALIKSVEGFEDFADFGRHQLKEAGASAGDMVVAITEGGETSFVIGTAWQGLDAGAEVFFVYNNPTDILCEHVERSRQIIQEPQIRKLDLFTGPMAVSGSTRMQATTIELLIVGAALESAMVEFLRLYLSQSELKELGVNIHKPDDYHNLFCNLLSDLSTEPAIDKLTAIAQLEEDTYRRRGLVTYFADSFMLDVLTDTTERSPTFMLPPFRRIDDTVSPPSWAFAKNPFHPTPKAWREMLRRPPRGLDWESQLYQRLNAPGILQTNPPRLDNDEIYKFQIGNEPDTSRTDAPDSAAVVVGVGEKAVPPQAAGFKQTAALCIGTDASKADFDKVFNIPCRLVKSPFDLWHRLAVKLVLNTVSTITMTRMGRVVGNAMIWLSPSNKKLIDRGCRLISHVTGCTYEKACIALHEAMEETRSQPGTPRQGPSPVAAAIENIGAGRDPSST
ncbi:MAG: sugar phosphate isomerase, partial [Planctomycetes bacterium]|nr:sugar phosphate isomerase [Planctomycetota bacterium]